MHVYKFGGSCSSSIASIQSIVKVVSDSNYPVCITLSASSGVTDQIIHLLAGNFEEKDVHQLISDLMQLHISLLPIKSNQSDQIEELLNKLKRLLLGVMYVEELTPRTNDLLLTFGERLIVIIVQEYFILAGIKCEIAYPEDLIITDGVHYSSLTLLEESKKQAQPILEKLFTQNEVIIIPGFYGVSEQGVVTIFGRSGTDYTATVLGYILDASSVTIWKDVNGFMSADPKIVPEAHTIPHLSYDEAAELSHFGAALLHPRAIAPSRIKNIPVLVRNLNDLEAKTIITDKTNKSEGIIKSISHMRGLTAIKVYTSVEGNKRGRFATISKKIEDSGVNIISIATSQTCIAFLMKSNGLENCVKLINSLGPGIVDKIDIKENIGLLCLVGQGFGETPGLAAKVFSTIAKEQINVELISAGASTCAFHFTVMEKDLNRAIQSFHQEIIN